MTRRAAGGRTAPNDAEDVGTVASAGTRPGWAREDHVHRLGDGAIDLASLFGTGVVETDALADDAVTLDKLADGSVDTASIVDAAVTFAKLASDVFALDTWTPALSSTGTQPNLGTGSSVWGRTLNLGTFALVFGAITWGTSGTSAGTGNYRIALPVAVNASFVGNTADVLGVASAVCAGNGKIGLCRWTSGDLMNIFDLTLAQWSATTPGAWTANDRIHFICAYPL